jgi:hypothetical protein
MPTCSTDNHKCCDVGAGATTVAVTRQTWAPMHAWDTDKCTEYVAVGAQQTKELPLTMQSSKFLSDLMKRQSYLALQDLVMSAAKSSLLGPKLERAHTGRQELEHLANAHLSYFDY